MRIFTTGFETKDLGGFHAFNRINFQDMPNARLSGVTAVSATGGSGSPYLQFKLPTLTEFFLRFAYKLYPGFSGEIVRFKIYDGAASPVFGTTIPAMSLQWGLDTPMKALLGAVATPVDQTSVLMLDG